jgi:REP element-mobilizing transposase RayT
MELNDMPQSLARNVIHLIYSTKNREPRIVPERRDELFCYLAGTLNALKCLPIKVGGVADHVHLMFCLARTLTLSKAVEELKKSSSKWMKERGGSPEFYWQNGYGAFSVSPSNEEAVQAYIARQAEHHKKRTFQEEYREFLRKHKIEWDER